MSGSGARVLCALCDSGPRCGPPRLLRRGHCSGANVLLRSWVPLGSLFLSELSLVFGVAPSGCGGEGEDTERHGRAEERVVVPLPRKHLACLVEPQVGLVQPEPEHPGIVGGVGS